MEEVQLIKKIQYYLKGPSYQMKHPRFIFKPAKQVGCSSTWHIQHSQKAEETFN